VIPVDLASTQTRKTGILDPCGPLGLLQQPEGDPSLQRSERAPIILSIPLQARKNTRKDFPGQSSTGALNNS
jgi:hypothetical protein